MQRRNKHTAVQSKDIAMQPTEIQLVSYKLCPYVQRAVITLEETGTHYQRININLNNKPDWFNALSPTGKVPLLKPAKSNENEEVLFESAAICEYINDISGQNLLSNTPLQRAKERAWIEFASQMLNQISKLYNAKNKSEFEQCTIALTQQCKKLEQQLIHNTQYFNGSKFSLVDAAFAPVFRYFDVFERELNKNTLNNNTMKQIFSELIAVQNWRQQLAQRHSVKKAVSNDYHQALVQFVKNKAGYLAELMQ